MALVYTSPWACSFLMCLTLSLTIGLEPILDKTEVGDGDRFSITCDAHRIKNGIRRCERTSLQILYNKPFESADMVAHYDDTLTKEIPAGRNWTIELTKGASNKVSELQVKIMVNDAKCSDAGFYTCECFLVSFDPISEDAELKRSPTCDLTTTKAITSVETSREATSFTTTKKPSNASVNLRYPKIFFLVLLAVIVVEMKCHVTWGAVVDSGVEGLNTIESGTDFAAFQRNISSSEYKENINQMGGLHTKHSFLRNLTC